MVHHNHDIYGKRYNTISTLYILTRNNQKRNPYRNERTIRVVTALLEYLRFKYIFFKVFNA